MSNEYGNYERGKKRKKKRSQVQIAKKLARRRNHGSDIDFDSYQYMVRVLELMKNDFPTAEEKLMFVNNVYEQISGQEIEYARNQVGSRVLDSFLPYANLKTIQRLVEAFGSSLRPLSSDKFASHVLQTIIVVCADRGNRESGAEEKNADAQQVEVKESEANVYNGIVLKLSKYLINNIEEFVFDTYANHLLRTAIECIGGLIKKPGCADRKKRLVAENRRAVAQDLKDLLFDVCNRLYKWPRFLEFGRDELTSGLLQCALYSLKDIFPEMTQAYVKKLTEECFVPGNVQQLSSIFDAECSVRLLEVCLAVADKQSFRKIYEGYFSGNLKRLSITRSTNFSVQRLLDHCSVKEDLERIFEEISVCFAEILRHGNTGVLASAANACLRLQVKQASFIIELLKALDCETKTKEEQHRILACILALKTIEEWEKERKEDNNSNTSISIHGSLIAQAILNFNKPIKLVHSLLETDTEELMRVFQDPKGSRVVDAFMDSKYIGEKSREKFVKKLKGYWPILAGSTYGSRSFDKIWQRARIDQKISIMEELAAVGESLRSTKSGIITSNKLNVWLFKRSKQDWREALEKEDKTRALFSDIIEDSTNKNVPGVP